MPGEVGIHGQLSRRAVKEGELTRRYLVEGGTFAIWDTNLDADI